ncbi:hypothetical protein HELRODRAFT_93209 [Helobdella robusta]|uniref:Sodium/nucleoside cotransporter n=1 Tax=Helobdella robusta TaxID=6412 RepID=T1G8U4_HELRO|nr:hypothetical protein HELRODRAFT_93209 [Helobdella robusta]ESO12301.1 hypothetical protein HELRODRAFT_93209 [Helobdella robusta]
MRHVANIQNNVANFWQKYKKIFKMCFLFLLVVLYFVYFTFALKYHFGDEGSIRLVWVTSLAVFGIVVSFIIDKFGEDIHKILSPLLNFVHKYTNFINWFLLASIFVGVIIMLIVDLTSKSAELYNLVSLSGVVVYVLLLFIFSVSPAKVKWRTVLWGFALQLAFALMILRWSFGYNAFKWLGDRVAEYLAYIDAGSEFVFGKSFKDHFFAMQVLPTVIFISSTITILFYLNVMQWVILKIAWVMQACMDTTAGESVNTAGNIFIGQTEAPLLIRPILPSMTKSEIHAVMTGGFATIAGGVLAAYILFGVPANHLLSASVMSAPAALGIAKLSYPETKKSLTTAKKVKALIEKCPEKNIVEAAASGASAAIPLVANIAANLLAFIALLEFMNATLTWFGDRVGSSQPITFQLVISYIMLPFALVMGVKVPDCRKVGQLIGVKTFINEFVAFEELGIFIDNRKKFDEHVRLNGTWEYSSTNDDIILQHPYGNSTVLKHGVIEDRSVVISTYALCGFSNISSIGIQIGAFTAMVPSRKKVFSKIAVRAMISGSVACFITACVAGLFYRAEV